MLNDIEKKELLKVKNNEELAKCIKKYNINLFDIANDKEITSYIKKEIPLEEDPEKIDVYFRNKEKSNE